LAKRGISRRTRIDPDLAQFIRESIGSVWRLELLLCLWRSAERSWSAAELVAELRASDSIVTDGLRQLQAVGLVALEAGERFRYAPASGALDRIVQQVAQLHREAPMAVTKALFAEPNEKIRTFADAFRLKKD
jgi:hypothetical protein